MAATKTSPARRRVGGRRLCTLMRHVRSTLLEPDKGVDSPSLILCAGRSCGTLSVVNFLTLADCSRSGPLPSPRARWLGRPTLAVTLKLQPQRRRNLHQPHQLPERPRCQILCRLLCIRQRQERLVRRVFSPTHWTRRRLVKIRMDRPPISARRHPSKERLLSASTEKSL